MKKLTWLFLAPLALGLLISSACGETTDTPPADAGTDAGTDAGPVTCGSDTMITVSGVAAIHPVSAMMDPTATMDGVTISLEDPALVLGGRDAVLKYEDCTKAVADLTADATTPTTATYSFVKVNTKSIGLGLIVTMNDTDAAGTKWVKTGMGLASGPQTADLAVEHPVVIVSNATEGALAQINGQSPGDLTAAGWIMGGFVDAANNPVDAVKLVDAQGAAITQAFYPTATLDGLETDGNTSAAGLFVVSGLGLASYNGEKAGVTCTSQQAATSPGSVFVVVLVCQ